jgi:uncharacterized membrane protein YkvA (DUF1232 family)
MEWLDSLRRRARMLGQEVHALWFAARHPRTPLGAKLLVALVVGYALSPIDLIPDFIPVLGLLDDLLLLPLGVACAIRLIPADVMQECRARVHAGTQLPRSRTAAGVIVALWLLLAVGLAVWARRFFGAP